MLVAGSKTSTKHQEQKFSDVEKVFKGQEHTAGKGWALTLFLAFSFHQEKERINRPYLIIDGVSRFDIEQGKIGKMILLIWKKSAQSNNL